MVIRDLQHELHAVDDAAVPINKNDKNGSPSSPRRIRLSRTRGPSSVDATSTRVAGVALLAANLDGHVGQLTAEFDVKRKRRQVIALMRTPQRSFDSPPTVDVGNDASCARDAVGCRPHRRETPRRPDGMAILTDLFQCQGKNAEFGRRFLLEDCRSHPFRDHVEVGNLISSKPPGIRSHPDR